MFALHIVYQFFIFLM